MLVPVPTRPSLRTAVPAPARVRSLLAAHVPLSLLLDLADPAGPQSRALLDAEAGAADWLPVA